jgi:hypothetical protein
MKLKIWQCFSDLPQQMPDTSSGGDFCLDLTNGDKTNQNVLQIWTCFVGNTYLLLMDNPFPFISPRCAYSSKDGLGRFSFHVLRFAYYCFRTNYLSVMQNNLFTYKYVAAKPSNHRGPWKLKESLTIHKVWFKRN